MVGGDKISCKIDCGTPTADTLLAKAMFNSAISTKNARLVAIDTKSFCLNTPMDRPERAKLKLANMPENIIKQCDLRAIEIGDRHVRVKMQKGMHGLPQAGTLAQNLLEKRLSKSGH